MRYDPAPRPARLQPAIALRASLKNYSNRDFRADLMAGIVVGIVALPLSMALAVASGVPPQHGLYTAIIAGGLIAILGGSRVQVSGPTAAFVVILAPISAKFGVAGLLLATMMAGAILVFMALARLGRLIEFIPHPVTTGFTAGIAVVIATLQIKDFLGLELAKLPEHYIEKVGLIIDAFPTFKWPDLAVGLATLAILLLWPRVTRRIPAPLVALAAAAIAAYALSRALPEFTVATINSRFSYVIDGVAHSGIPQLPPLPGLPTAFPGPDAQSLVLSYDMLRSLLGSAFAIAMLGAIESLLSAVISDGMTGHRHDPDAELLAQGVGNLVAPLFGGFAATGAIARTATGVRSGSRSPIAAIVHAVFVLAAVLSLAPLLGYLPMASLAALLLLVAWNMAEIKHFAHILRVGPRSDVFVLIACFALTVIFDMVVSVTVGVVLAALLFMQRMADISGSKIIGEGHPELPEPLPPGVILYRIGGPLFFGAAQKAISALHSIADTARVLILDVSDVPTIDATGLVSLESALDRLRKSNVFVVVAGVRKQPLQLMAKAGWKHRDWLVILSSFQEALLMARALAGSDFDAAHAARSDAVHKSHNPEMAQPH